MKRRDFLMTSTTAGISGVLSPLHSSSANAAERQATLPETLAGMPLPALLQDYRDRFYHQYLPFWLKGGYDQELGGVMCNLNDDGTVADDEKYIWYQGRELWVYSYLYRHFGQDSRYLEMARKTRDFMVRHMRADGGRWYERVHRDGRIKEGVIDEIYGGLFAAQGLAEFYRVAGGDENLDMARESIRSAVNTYDAPGYRGIKLPGQSQPAPGLRCQGHCMIFISLLTGMLRFHDDPELERLQGEHVDLEVEKFNHPEYGITNEYLQHDYSRLPGFEDHTFTDHAMEAQWMLMDEALRTKDRSLFDLAMARVRRYIELRWDYIFDGFGYGDYWVFGGLEGRPSDGYREKAMWTHTEILIATMMALEYTGESWAREWYDRVHRFTMRNFADPSPGVWIQATDRRGKSIPREGVHPKRRCNYHQPRCQMLNMLSLERMIRNNGELTPFST